MPSSSFELTVESGVSLLPEHVSIQLLYTSIERDRNISIFSRNTFIGSISRYIDCLWHINIRMRNDQRGSAQLWFSLYAW
jgi:hypothetical protein